jgi:hypothetical protein
MRATFTVALLVVGIAGPGCSRSGDENLGLATRPANWTVDVAQLTQPAELAHAASMPGREVDKRLGAHRFEATSKMKIEPPGKPAETLEEAWRLDTDANSDFHALKGNDHGYGFEATVSGGDLYVRPRYGKFVKRKPEGDEVDRLRAAIDGVAGDYVKLLERWLQVREDGKTTVAGRPAVKLKLSASASPAPVTVETDASRKWRETVNVRYVDGDVLIDEKTGAVVGMRLETSYTFDRDVDGKQTGPFAVTLDYKQSAGAPEPVQAPADAVAAPHRTRPMLDRAELLDGLK